MLLSPGGHQSQNGPKTLTMPRERILDAWRHLGVDLAADDVVALQLPELLRKHLFGGSGEEFLELAEPADASLEVKQN